MDNSDRLFEKALGDMRAAKARGANRKSQLWHGKNMVRLHRDNYCDEGARIVLTSEQYDAIDRRLERTRA